MIRPFTKWLLTAGVLALCAPRAAMAQQEPCGGRTAVIAAALVAPGFVAAQAEGAVTQVALPPNSSTSGNITIKNNCPDGATFSVSVEPGSATQWVELSSTTVAVKGRDPASGEAGSTDFSIAVNTAGMQPGTHHEATITVKCIGCPHCTAIGTNTYTISLDVTAPPKPGGGGGSQTPGGTSAGQPSASPPSSPTPGSTPTPGSNPGGTPVRQPPPPPVGSTPSPTAGAGTKPESATGQQSANSNPATSYGPGTNPAGGQATGGSNSPQGGTPTSNTTSSGGGSTPSENGVTGSSSSGQPTGLATTTDQGGGVTNGSDTVPSPTSNEIPLLDLVLGGLAVAGGLAGPFIGSGRPTTAQTTQTSTDGKQPVAPQTTDKPGAGTNPVPQTQLRRDWTATLDQSSPGDTPLYSPGDAPAQPGGTAPTPVGPSGGMSSTPVQPTQAGGGLPPGAPTPGSDTVIPAAPGPGGTTDKPGTIGKPGQPVGTKGKEGAWGSSLKMGGPGSDTATPAAPGPGGTTDRPGTTGKPGQAVGTKDKGGAWGSSLKMGGSGSDTATPGAPAAPGPGTTGDKTGSAEKPGQPIGTREKDGAWGSSLKMKEGEHKPGDLNEGGGHTFSRGTTHEDLIKANQPPTAEETAAAKPGTGRDDYATREKKLRQRMADRRIAQESTPPIAVDPDKPWTPTQVTAQPFVPVTQEDKDRLAYIDKKIADSAAKFSNLITNDPKEAMRNATLAKFWNDLKTHYAMLSKGLKDEIDDLRRLDNLLAQAKADAPSKVSSYQSMVAEHEYIVYLYGTRGADAVDKYRQDEAEKQYYGAVPGMAAGGAAMGVGATFGAISSAAPRAPAAGEATSPPPRASTEPEPSPRPALEDDQGPIASDWDKAPEDPKGGWGTQMPWDYDDASPPVLTDPETGEAIPARVDPETGALVPESETPGGANQPSVPSSTAMEPQVNPDAETQVGPRVDPKGETQADLLPYDHMPAKGTQKTGFGDPTIGKIPIDPSGKPGTRLPFKQGWDALNDPTDPPIDPQTGEPIQEEE